ncbi:ribonuclease P protein component 1 [Natrialbaceae archaeon AArc-T1-2]|uniref:ribonuclease P protein component 1 n=1 Tax=Natrialbaceae archaeon AArc-T1-2 TaxID=3053904 RepID=UPI00255AC1FA|nr:ribonuclease P protein component 1 [Natrialbaceae archaeon AArc-T1-2]WIV67311.1 ribonuclease P protein component 1 [Natrialbaceae archaeon AArc-T1-2]
MALTPETLPRHELNGLPVRVVDSDDPGTVGLEGRVVVETTNTLQIAVCENGSSRVVQVPKSGSTFEFAITDDAADYREELGTASELAGEDVAYVTVDGSRLLSRPARRTETSGDSPWQ